ncbi:uncharacterized protein LOC119005670 [Acanthopagrus latus]|uniref:uncharacterized protein LOC119005670 n=1 Tax=Acanthopagrus latus TaxID=8177 RepID=UPI00187C94A7|nr:uncharacterized protein LOC119005670 [Acanthopagrus latus]
MNPSNRRQTWTREEVQCLIEIWSDDYINSQLLTTHKNTKIQSLFSKRLGERGYRRSAAQCCIKAKILRKEYIKAKSCPSDYDFRTHMADSRRMLENIHSAEQSQMTEEAAAFERILRAQQEAEKRRFHPMQAQQQATNQMFLQIMGTLAKALIAPCSTLDPLPDDCISPMWYLAPDSTPPSPLHPYCQQPLSALWRASAPVLRCQWSAAPKRPPPHSSTEISPEAPATLSVSPCQFNKDSCKNKINTYICICVLF